MLDYKKLGIVTLGCLSLIMVGCEHEADPEEAVATPVSIENNNVEEISIYTIDEVVLEEDFIFLQLLNEAGDFSNLTFDEAEIEIEENGQRRQGSIEDLTVGDVLTIYWISAHAPHVIEKIVIIR